MPFAVSGSQIFVSGTETGLSFRTWAASNTAAAKQLTANTVEALYQLKIQNGAVFDTSNVALVISHRVEGQANATTDSGIWRCKGGVVIVQGANNAFSEEWAIQDWENVHVYIQKTGGMQSFIGSSARATPSAIKNVKFIVKSGDIDAHLQATGGTGTIFGLLLRNEGVNTGIVGINSTDTSGADLYRLEPFAFNGAPTTFHTNWQMYNASTNEINFNYRRNNGGAVFYNVTNTANGQKMTAIRYVSNGALASDAARSVLVGAYKPTLQSSSGAALSGVEVSIRRDSDGVIEASGVTGIDGRITIVAGSTALREQSYNNTFTVGGISYQKIIREAGVKYIKQSVTPATTGGNVVSVDQGTFTVIQRRADLLELKATQSFLADYEGAKTVFADTLFTGTVAQAAAISGIAFVVASGAVTVTVSSSVTGQDVYNLWKHWTSQSAQMAVDQALITIVSGVLMIAGGMTTSAVVAAGGNIKGLQATGTLATIAGGSYTLPISDSKGNSNLVFADVDSWTVYYDAARASQVGAGGLGQNFRFNYTSGTTYYLSLVVSGETFLKEVTPTSAGNTTVSLSSVALLSAIGAKVSALGTPAQAAALEALAIVNHSEHDTTRAAIAAIPVAPSAAAIRTELEAVGGKLDSANKAAKAAKRQTL